MRTPIILAYAGNHSLLSVTPDDAKRLTHINLAFGLVDKSSRLDGSKLTNIDYTKTIRRWNTEIKFVLSVGGWGAGGFSEMAMQKETRDRFAADCAAFVRAHDLDGVDIDWEYPCSDSAGIGADPSDKFNFTHLLQALRDALGKDKIVSIAAGAGAYFVRDTQMDKVAEICDYVQLMTYDMRSGFCRQAGHHTALYLSEGDDSGKSTQCTVELFARAGVPKEKIVIGAAFYSRVWSGVPNVNGGLLQQAQSIGNYGPGYGDLVEKYIDKNGYARVWDARAMAAYLFNGSELISYDDPLALRAKCEYLQTEGLLGIMYWEHGCDPTHTLLWTIADALQKR